jgi:hypothetical protein
MDYIASEPPQVTHRESIKGFPNPSPPKKQMLPRKQFRNSWRVPCLNREFEADVAAVGGFHLRLLADAGINSKMIRRLPFRKIGFVRAEIHDRFYSRPKGFRHYPHQTGWPLYVIPAFDDYDRIVDLVGFHFAQPRKFWLRTGHGFCLGDPGSSILHVDITEFVKDGARGCFSLAGNNG